MSRSTSTSRGVSSATCGGGSGSRARPADSSIARLQHHDADRVGDDVVQLACDTRSLLGDGLARAGVAFGGELRGAVDEHVLALAPAAHEAPGEQRATEEDDEEGEVRGRDRIARLDRGERDRDRDEGDADDQGAAGRVATDRVDGDEDRDGEGGGVAERRRREVGELDDDGGDAEGDERRALAEGERRAEDKRRRVAGRAVARELRLGRDLQAEGREQRGGEQVLAVAGDQAASGQPGRRYSRARRVTIARTGDLSAGEPLSRARRNGPPRRCARGWALGP
jgi:hypothetical protein